jgi:hypothetical protein
MRRHGCSKTKEAWSAPARRKIRMVPAALLAWCKFLFYMHNNNPSIIVLPGLALPACISCQLHIYTTFLVHTVITMVASMHLLALYLVLV